MSEKWHKAAQIYEILQHRTDTPYVVLAHKMLDLIAKLSIREEFANVKVSTGMMTLLLGVSGSKLWIHVHWQLKGNFTVGIESYEPDYHLETEEVAEIHIVDKVIEYLHKLQNITKSI